MTETETLLAQIEEQRKVLDKTLRQRNDAEQALADMREIFDQHKANRDKELVALTAVIGQYKLDLEATGNALGLLKEAARLLDEALPATRGELMDEIDGFVDKPEIKAILKKGR